MNNNNSSKNVLYHWPANTNGTSWSKADWRNMQSKINCIIMICRFIHRFLTLICWLRYDITLKMVMMIAIRVDLSYHKMWEICIGEEYTFILKHYCFIMMLKMRTKYVTVTNYSKYKNKSKIIQKAKRS